ncbi:hypothetical protein [Marinobacter sp. VGCF2001]|uniref:hypothetical protein n=1 Tax=Marinobacter sp. VGCF2001 TaxID=3417189 RepID=UPI003CED2766
MKMPVVTITLVCAALAYVLWDQARESSAPAGAGRFSNLAAHPASRSEVLDFMVGRIPGQCTEAVGQASGPAFNDCAELADSRSSSCRRSMADRLPDNVASEAVFRDLSISMINCLIPKAGVVKP